MVAVKLDWNWEEQEAFCGVNILNKQHVKVMYKLKDVCICAYSRNIYAKNKNPSIN